jgi:glucan-binding YG repeat protein
MKKSIKRFLPFVIILALCMSLFTVSAFARDKRDPEFVQDTDGVWHAIDTTTGDQIERGWVSQQGKDKDGNDVISWYFVEKGNLVDGWQHIGDDWYYFGDTGAFDIAREGKPAMYMNSEKFGPQYIDDGKDHSNEDWREVKDYWWFNADGTVSDGGWASTMYKDAGTAIDEDGHLYDTSKRIFYYVNSDGSVYKGWLEDTGEYFLDWMYTRTDDVVASYWLEPGPFQTDEEFYATTPRYATWYDGVVGTNGWVAVQDVRPDIDLRAGEEVWDAWFEDPTFMQDTKWYLANPDGTLVHGWANVDGNWYYFGVPETPSDELGDYGYNRDKENFALTQSYDTRNNNTAIYSADDGAWYNFARTGEMLTGWDEDYDTGDWTYFDPATGQQVFDDWQQIDGQWYYFDDQGILVENDYVDGYYVGDTGAYVPGHDR